MTTELPEKPESRKESYLAKIAGESVTIPEKPESRIEQYLAYIAEHGGGGGGGIPTDVIDTIWFGTQDQYDAIGTKAEKTLYLVKEETVTANTLSASPAVLNLPKINLGNANILNNVDNVTLEKEMEEPEGEVEEEKLEEEENIESEE